MVVIAISMWARRMVALPTIYVKTAGNYRFYTISWKHFLLMISLFMEHIMAIKNVMNS